uniref:Uncharacterized protein n=1 Tax=Arundo donax TaxID=35708 RepID=A0A0A9GZC5_ARUDO
MYVGSVWFLPYLFDLTKSGHALKNWPQFGPLQKLGMSKQIPASPFISCQIVGTFKGANKQLQEVGEPKPPIPSLISA